MHLKTPISRLRLIGLLEGISFLFLLFIAMPLKYKFDFPLAVKYTGWAHGLLFILYIAALFDAYNDRKWPIVKAFYGFIASLLPFGTFVFDKTLKKEQD